MIVVRQIALLSFALFLLCPGAARAESAQETVKKAIAAYQSGEYEKAGDHFHRAYELSQVPNQLRNAAKAYQKAGVLEKAETEWRAYSVLTNIAPSERAEAEAQLALIEEQRKTKMLEAERLRAEEERAEAEAGRKRAEDDAAKAAAAAEADQEPGDAARGEPKDPEALPDAPQEKPAAIKTVRRSSQPSWLTSNLGPLASFAASGVLGAISLYLFLDADRALSGLDDALAQTNGAGLVIGISRADAMEALDDVNDQRNVGAGALALSGAALATGVVWLILNGNSEGTDVAAAPVVSTTSEGDAHLGFFGRF